MSTLRQLTSSALKCAIQIRFKRSASCPIQFCTPASLLTMGFRALILALLVAVGAAAQNTTQKEKPAGLERKPAQPLPT